MVSAVVFTSHAVAPVLTMRLTLTELTGWPVPLALDVHVEGFFGQVRESKIERPSQGARPVIW